MANSKPNKENRWKHNAFYVSFDDIWFALAWFIKCQKREPIHALAISMIIKANFTNSTFRNFSWENIYKFIPGKKEYIRKAIEWGIQNGMFIVKKGKGNVDQLVATPFKKAKNTMPFAISRTNDMNPKRNGAHIYIKCDGIKYLDRLYKNNEGLPFFCKPNICFGRIHDGMSDTTIAKYNKIYRIKNKYEYDDYKKKAYEINKRNANNKSAQTLNDVVTLLWETALLYIIEVHDERLLGLINRHPTSISAQREIMRKAMFGLIYEYFRVAIVNKCGEKLKEKLDVERCGKKISDYKLKKHFTSMVNKGILRRNRGWITHEFLSPDDKKTYDQNVLPNPNSDDARFCTYLADVCNYSDKNICDFYKNHKGCIYSAFEDGNGKIPRRFYRAKNGILYGIAHSYIYISCAQIKLKMNKGIPKSKLNNSNCENATF